MVHMNCENCKYEIAVCELLESIRLNAKDFEVQLRDAILDLSRNRNSEDCSNCDFFINHLIHMPRQALAIYVQEKRKINIREKLLNLYIPPSGLAVDEIILENTYYLDHNIFDKCRREKAIYDKLMLCTDVNFVYSLVHVDEANKCSDENIKNDYLDIINNITKLKCAIVVNNSKPRLGFGQNLPQNFIEQVKKYKVITSLEEQMRLIDFGDRFVFFNDYRDGISIDKLDDRKLSHFFTLYGFNNNGRILLDRNQRSNYIELRVAFYAFFMTLDCIRYRSDKDVHTVISGTHDWEHLLYASNSTYFITEDERLRERAEVIYKKFGFATQTLSLEDFFSSRPNLNHNTSDTSNLITTDNLSSTL